MKKLSKKQVEKKRLKCYYLASSWQSMKMVLYIRLTEVEETTGSIEMNSQPTVWAEKAWSVGFFIDNKNM